MKKYEIMEARHSVRNFLDKPIEKECADRLNMEIAACNKEGNLHFQLFTDEPCAFRGNKTHYGQFSGCKNYIALVGPKDADEAVGYYGERLVLLAQELGLNTCWVALTYKKGAVVADKEKDEKLHLVVALGYGANQGVAHKSKDATAVSNLTDKSPQWFRDGVKAALLAPTALNQQKFFFENKDGTVSAKAKPAFYSKIDLGIAMYHFELGAGKENFRWTYGTPISPEMLS